MRQPGPEQRRLHRTRSRRQTGQCRPRGQEEGGQRQGEAPRGKKRKEEVKRVQDLEEESSSDDDEGTDSEGEEADKQVRIVHKVRKVDDQGKERQSRWVTIRLGHKRKQIRLFCNTGSNQTIIPPELYKPSMGKVVKAASRLRAWGADKYMKTQGMFKTTLDAANGAKKETWVNVVKGVKPESLLGDHDAKNLGITIFNADGLPGCQNKIATRPPDKASDGVRTTRSAKSNVVHSPNITGASTRSNDNLRDTPDPHNTPQEQHVQGISIPAKPRKSGKEVTTMRPALHNITNKGKEGTRPLTPRSTAPRRPVCEKVRAHIGSP